ncbi:transporter [Lithospermum erythrorhizon]|uniref:Transporter n=1 Tax=Lithospermum erythrorhizon TaxID=34254 RepID=A0AAV3RW20_LITER
MSERFAYYGISSNLINYLTGPLGQSTAVAAANVNTWVGTASLLPFWVLFLLTPSSVDFGPLSSLLYSTSLHLDFAISQAAHNPCIVAFGADQFDIQHPQESLSKTSFFNWWTFGVTSGPLATLIFLNYIQDNYSWALGFFIPCISVAISLTLFLHGCKSYRYAIKVEDKSMIQRVQRLLTKTTTYWKRHPYELFDEERALGSQVPHLYSKKFEFLNQAILAPGTNTTEHQEIIISETEEAKGLLSLFPIWFTSLEYGIVSAQTSTFFTEQTKTINRNVISNLQVPPASLQYLIGISVIICIPIYGFIFVPIARSITKHPSGITKLQRVGIGMVICSVSMIIAGFVEFKRLEIALLNAVPMSFWWLLPQYILFGISNVFTLIGLQELFYDQVPCELKGIGLSLFLSIFGTGCFISSFLISIIQDFTSKGGNGGWFPDNLNQGHLDYFYWLLAEINSLGFVIYVTYAQSFKYYNKSG